MARGHVEIEISANTLKLEAGLRRAIKKIEQLGGSVQVAMEGAVDGVRTGLPEGTQHEIRRLTVFQGRWTNDRDLPIRVARDTIEAGEFVRLDTGGRLVRCEPGGPHPMGMMGPGMDVDGVRPVIIRGDLSEQFRRLGTEYEAAKAESRARALTRTPYVDPWFEIDQGLERLAWVVIWLFAPNGVPLIAWLTGTPWSVCFPWGQML